MGLIGCLIWLVVKLTGLETVLTYVLAWIERANNPEDQPTEQFVPYTSAIVSALWEWGTSIILWLTWPIGWIDFDPYPRSDSPKPPVLLVHGWGMNRAAWLRMRQQLKRQGYANVFTVNLPLTGGGGIPAYAKLVHERIEGLAPYFPGAGWVLVGHGMGGLVVRRYLKDQGDDRVARAVLLGTPNEGSRLAVLSLGEAGRQMQQKSAFLDDLKRRGKREPKDRMVTVTTRFDNKVIPATSAALKGTEEIAFDFLGHNTLLVSNDVYTAVADSLRSAEQAAADAAGAAVPEGDAEPDPEA